MSTTPTFSGEVSLYNDPASGLRVECSQRHVTPLQKCLINAGFTCQSHIVAVAGTSQIHPWVEFAVTGDTFDTMKQVVSDCLESAGVKIEEEDFSMLSDRQVRLNLANISVFDR